jgi:hypothetical protein
MAVAVSYPGAYVQEQRADTVRATPSVVDPQPSDPAQATRLLPRTPSASPPREVVHPLRVPEAPKASAARCCA